ncbi:acyl carrier protein [Streptomyces sp. NPDC060031]|uniref:acyl carrier protein n=1 Tax=Streptomyces sp. NPDC060031 TaxID=3347043 RepID=UPI00369FC99B
MGTPGQLKRPALPAGRLRDLNSALHALHLVAGQPSLDTMHRLLDKRISRTRLHDAFTEPRLPPWDTVDALVEVLATRAPGRTPGEVLPEVHALWVLASQQRSLLDPGEAEITDGVVETFALYLEVRPRGVLMDVPVCELGGDSLFVLNVVGSLEQEYGIVLDEKDWGQDSSLTVADFVRLTLAAYRKTRNADGSLAAGPSTP